MAWLGMRKNPQMVNIQLELPVSFIQEGASVIAYTPALDISTVGKDKADAKRMFDELVAVFFDDIVKNNTLDDVLTGLGWKKSEGVGEVGWQPPVITQESYKVKVPVLA
jgi:hypothetical protein